MRPGRQLQLGLAICLQVLFAQSSASAPGGASLDIVLSDRDQVYRSVAQTLVAQLERGQTDWRIRLDWQLAGQYVVRDTSVTVAVGMRACAAAADQAARGALLCIFVPKAGFDALARRQSGPAVAAIYLDQPPVRQFALGRALLPSA